MHVMQVGLDDSHRSALIELLVACASQEAFTQLRTREQLGYIVSLSSWRQLTMHGIAIVIQASSYAAPHLDERAEAFLKAYESQLAGMDAATFASQVSLRGIKDIDAFGELQAVLAHCKEP